MENRNILYWIAKLFITSFMLFSAWYLYVHKVAFNKLGFPDYFRIEIVLAKIVGAFLLLIPAVSLRVKEWIYAGFGMTMVSALIAHVYCYDPISDTLFVAVDFLLFALSVRYVSKTEYALANVTTNQK